MYDDVSRRDVLRSMAGLTMTPLLADDANAADGRTAEAEFEAFQKAIAEEYNEMLREESDGRYVWDLFDVENTDLDRRGDSGYAVMPTDPEDGGPYKDFSDIPDDRKDEFWQWLERGVKGMVPATAYQLKDTDDRPSQIEYAMIDVDNDGIRLDLDVDQAVAVYDDHQDYDPSIDAPLDGREPIIEDMEPYFTIQKDQPD